MADRQWFVNGLQIQENGEEEYFVNGVQINEDQADAAEATPATYRLFPDATPKTVWALKP